MLERLREIPYLNERTPSAVRGDFTANTLTGAYMQNRVNSSIGDGQSKIAVLRA